MCKDALFIIELYVNVVSILFLFIFIFFHLKWQFYLIKEHHVSGTKTCFNHSGKQHLFLLNWAKKWVHNDRCNICLSICHHPVCKTLPKTCFGEWKFTPCLGYSTWLKKVYSITKRHTTKKIVNLEYFVLPSLFFPRF